jgi:Galactose oxidase, central domain
MKRPLLGFLVLATFVWNANAQTPETFVLTGNMTTPRQYHTATLLRDGRVLIAGGFAYLDPNSTRPTVLATTELYDPSTGTFSPTGTMTTGRASQTAALLPDGRVLIAGGFQYNASDPTSLDFSLGSAELYDPVTGSFTPTGNMVNAQYGPTATLLNNGKVLITGGFRPMQSGMTAAYLPVDAGAELYDPSTGSFSPVDMAVKGSPPSPRSPWGPATPVETIFTKTAPLFDSKILISGGFAAAKLYNPATNAAESLGFPARLPFLSGHTATLLPTGKVLIAGGFDLGADYFDPPLEQAVLYDPASRTFQATQSLIFGRAGHTATLLLGGLLLIAGGVEKGEYDPPSETFNLKPALTAELFDPYTETFRLTGDMVSLHGTATLLGNGTVLFSGGNTTAAELYLPPLLTLDTEGVRSGDSFTATFSGRSLNNETYYDLRFHAPGDSTDYMALNWQRRLSATHTVATGMAAGTWIVTGVRAHQNIDDHNGDFASVSVELKVTR